MKKGMYGEAVTANNKIFEDIMTPYIIIFLIEF